MLTHELAIDAVLREGAFHEIQQAAIPARAAGGAHLGVC